MSLILMKSPYKTKSAVSTFGCCISGPDFSLVG